MSKPVLTEERAKLLSEILISDKDRAKKLLGLGAPEAMRKINALGNDFTLEEIKEYGKALVSASEVNDEALESVAGGASADMAGDAIPASLLRPAILPALAITKAKATLIRW